MAKGIAPRYPLSGFVEYQELSVGQLLPVNAQLVKYLRLLL
jgi:hypothetical protein